MKSHEEIQETFAFIFLIKPLSQRQGKCYATRSMRKVELELEFIFLSGSVFLPRLVQQVISVPFVV